MSRKITKGSATPWGPAQTVLQKARGIYVVTTASHGGAYVPRELPMSREARVYAQRWSGDGEWFEEDCAVNFVILELLPDARFREDSIASLKRFAPDYEPPPVPGYTECPACSGVLVVIDQRESELSVEGLRWEHEAEVSLHCKDCDEWCDGGRPEGVSDELVDRTIERARWGARYL